MSLLVNKKARHDYSIAQTLEAGVVLSGPEVKSLRHKKGSLQGSYIKIVGGEAFLINAQINPYEFADNREYDPKRTRKLLLKKKEIYFLQEADQQKGTTIVPLSFEVVNRKIKLKLGIGKGKKEFEKRAVLKKRAIERDIRREMKEKVRLR